MENATNIYCAYDTLNPTYREDGTEKHCCEYYNSYLCIKCPSRYDGDKVKKYMEDNPREHQKDKNFIILSSQNYSYKDFIEEILNQRGRFNCKENEYKECHHILPKSKGGDNSIENLIDLYGREHFIAHQLLAKENPNDKQLVFAWWMMAHCAGKNKYEITPEEYEEAKQQASIKISEMKKGFVFSGESKEK